MKRPPGSKHSIHYLTHSMKKVGRSVGRRNCSSIAKQAMNHTRIRQFILKRVGKLIRKDMERICSKQASSILRERSPDAMKSFTWADFIQEMEQSSPVFCQMLKECVQRKRRKAKQGTSYAVDDAAVIGMSVAMLLRHRNTRMNLVQRIISTLL